MKEKIKASAIGGVVVVLTLLLAVLSAQVHASDLGTARDKKAAAIAERAAAQQKIDAEVDRGDELQQKYEETLAEIENLTVYTRQLQDLINDQDREAIAIQSQLANLSETHEGIVPAMVRMLQTLTDFVATDMPFLAGERSARLEGLSAMMGKANISVSEKFRRILEAYQVELEYGRTIEAYQDQVKIETQPIVVNILRVGRVALFCQSLDGDKTAMWSVDERTWVKLTDEFNTSIKKGIKMAQKRLPPDLLMIPMRKPEVLL